jgi:hypothetical protein
MNRSSPILGERREGKVRPIPGNAPHDRPVSRDIFSLRGICDDPFAATRFPQLQTLPGPSAGVFKAWRNLSVRCGFKIKTKPGDGTVPPPVGRSRARVVERAGRITLQPIVQMSSGRLFLDRVARQQSPSPLYRQPEHNTHSAAPRPKGDISTLLARGHFYFALTAECSPLAP